MVATRYVRLAGGSSGGAGGQGRALQGSGDSGDGISIVQTATTIFEGMWRIKSADISMI